MIYTKNPKEAIKNLLEWAKVHERCKIQKSIIFLYFNDIKYKYLIILNNKKLIKQ